MGWRVRCPTDAGSPARRETGEYRARIVQSWLLALLRFAITSDNNDRLAVYAIAAEADGRVTRSTGFSFFRKTSAELCNAIANPHHAASSAILRRHLDRMEDGRLKQAFAAALEHHRPEPRARLKSARSKGRRDLWKGLPARPRSPRRVGSL